MIQIRTSETEIKHLIIAWVAISLAFAILFAREEWMYGGPSPFDLIRPMILALFTVGIAFLLHEMAHKVIAQMYGCWAEFRMSPPMLMFAILFAYVAGIVFAAPGAVMIFGPHITPKQNGKIAVAGPIMNLLLAPLFLPLLTGTGLIREIGAYGFVINVFIAAFNVLPISVLDGRKVLYWSKKAYLLILLASFGMLTWAFIKVVPYLSF
ncbi:MAG: hypothetical protein QMC78_02220 [Methanocellales archaeon]|nr:hypothetical protein [Methanocellales archaeon]